MFSCCRSSSLVSKLEKSRSWTLSRRLRHVFSPRTRKIWPFTEKKLKNPPQKIHKKKNSIIYSVYTKKGDPKGWHRLWCVCGSNQDLCETCVVRTFKAGSLEQLVEHLVPAFLEGDLSFIHVFLGTYRTFTTIQQVLYLLFQRYGFNCPHSAREGESQEELKDAISFILNTWLDAYPEDFDQPPYFPCLKLLVEYLQVNLPGSELEQRAHLLRAQLGHLKPTEAEPEGLAPDLKAADDLGPPPGDPAPAPILELHRGSTLPSPAPTPDGEPAGGLDSLSKPPLEPSPVPPGEVDPAPELTPKLDIIPGSPSGAPRPLADIPPAPASTLEISVAPGHPYPAPSQALDEENAGKPDSYPGPAPELALGSPADVDPACAPALELNAAPVPPSSALVQTPDEEPTGNPDSYAGPCPEPTPVPPGEVDPAPEPTSESD